MERNRKKYITHKGQRNPARFGNCAATVKSGTLPYKPEQVGWLVRNTRSSFMREARRITHHELTNIAFSDRGGFLMVALRMNSYS